MTVSLALSTAGGLSHSYASHYNGVMPAYSVGEGMTMVNTNSMVYTVNRGTFSAAANAVVIASDGGNFVEDVSFAITSSVVSMVPAAATASLGDASTSAVLGAAITS